MEIVHSKREEKKVTVKSVEGISGIDYRGSEKNTRG